MAARIGEQDRDIVRVDENKQGTDNKRQGTEHVSRSPDLREQSVRLEAHVPAPTNDAGEALECLGKVAAGRTLQGDRNGEVAEFRRLYLRDPPREDRLERNADRRLVGDVAENCADR